VEVDKRLEEAVESTRLELAQHRWHWTRDETNPDRVSIREYARAVGRSQTTVADIVNAYTEWSVRGAPDTEFGDYQARAKLRGDTLTAAEAVAKARGVTLDSARRHHTDEVRQVKAVAQERAERKGTTVEAEVASVADMRERVRQSGRNREAERKASHSLRYIEAEGKVAVAMRNLRAVLADTEGVEFTAEERELLSAAFGQLRAVLNLLDMRIIGTANIDWDAEVAKLDGAS